MKVGLSLIGTFFLLIGNICYAKELSFDDMLNLAKNGNIIAQNNVGMMYYTGNKTPRVFSEAAYWFEKSANQGFVDAMYNLGFLYENGQGVPKDASMAYDWYFKAAQKGSSSAMYNIGKLYQVGLLNGGASNFKYAEKWVRKAAIKGNIEAQNRLAYFYTKGWGVTKDEEKAFKWYLKAAKGGLAKAQHNIGENYYFGEGVAIDFGESMRWYEKAAKQGFVNSMIKLSNFYIKTSNSQKGYYWLQKAAQLDNKKAKDLKSIVFELSPEIAGIPKDADEAFVWHKAKASEGDRDAMYKLGRIYLHMGDEPEGVKWIESASDLGQPYAKSLVSLNRNYYEKRSYIKRLIKDEKKARNSIHNSYKDFYNGLIASGAR